jgi:hypothetical protein
MHSVRDHDEKGMNCRAMFNHGEIVGSPDFAGLGAPQDLVVGASPWLAALVSIAVTLARTANWKDLT